MTEHTYWSRLGIRPTINACGIYTDFGGSRLSPAVWRAMTESNEQFIYLPDLLERSGERIATLLGAPAARITPGAAAAIMLGTAACMAGSDGDNSARLPQTRGMNNEVLIQAGHRYKYDRQVSMTGARLVEIGSANGTRPEQLREAITDKTAMILHPAHLDERAGCLVLEQVVEIAAGADVPVFVDAAYMNYPTALMSSYLARGANLVTLSAKYFGGPNAGGFVMGDAALVAAVANVHFTRYESGDYLKYGRPLKMDRQTIVAVLVALEEWLEMDHDARFEKYRQQVDALASRLSGIEGLRLEARCFTMDERFVEAPVNCLSIGVDSQRAGIPAADLGARLADENPAIAAIVDGNRLGIVMDVLNDAEVEHIGARLLASLNRQSSFDPVR